jgi:plastocyanin
MARRSLYVLGVTLLGLLAVPAWPASAGGGCHTGATTGGGNTVELRDMCFTPTTLRIDPGGTVTFVNRDSLTHMVGGMGWGTSADLIAGEAFTATFADAGIYPYACIYHPGMTGAIVVGEGSGAGNGAAVTVASYQPPAPSPQVEVRTVPEGSNDAGVATGWLLGGALGLLAGLGGGLALRRRTRRVPVAL